jgi:hypothetical protein
MELLYIDLESTSLIPTSNQITTFSMPPPATTLMHTDHAGLAKFIHLHVYTVYNQQKLYHTNNHGTVIVGISPTITYTHWYIPNHKWCTLTNIANPTNMTSDLRACRAFPICNSNSLIPQAQRPGIVFPHYFWIWMLAGKVLLNGVETRSIPLARLRPSLCVVPQTPLLISGTIRLTAWHGLLQVLGFQDVSFP